MKRVPVKRFFRRLEAAALAVGTLWAASVTAGSNTASAALAALRESCTVTLRLYIQSDYAQIAYCLSPETMGKLVALGMPLSISSLSWGEVAI